MLNRRSGKVRHGAFREWMILVCFAFVSFLNVSAIDQRDPIKETQTTPVLVTDELLNREGGEPGPASPSFKLKDSADFFSREPYGPEEESAEIKGEESEEPEEFGEDWLFWEKDEENSEDSDLIPLEEE